MAEFLNWLFEVKKLSVSTIKGYRSAIARVMKRSMGVDIFQDNVLSDLIANFHIERPFCPVTLPKWDLNIVLNSLSKAPYEPIISSSLVYLARKTAFLLLLSSGARRGEIHALDSSAIIREAHGNIWWLKPNIKFMAKNFNPATGRGKFEGFKITKLKKLAKDDRLDDCLCPVRALHWCRADAILCSGQTTVSEADARHRR